MYPDEQTYLAITSGYCIPTCGFDTSQIKCSFTARFFYSVIYQQDWKYSPFTTITGVDFKHYTITMTMTTTTTTTTTEHEGQLLTPDETGYGYSEKGYESSYTDCENSDAVLCGCQAVPVDEIDDIKEVGYHREFCA